MFNLRMQYVKTHRITNTDLRTRANIPTLNSTKQVRTLHQLRKDSLKEIDSLSRRSQAQARRRTNNNPGDHARRPTVEALPICANR